MSHSLNINEKDVADGLAKALTTALQGDGLYTIQTHQSLSTLFARKLIADILVRDVDGNPVAVFDVKGFPQAWALRLQMDSSLSRTLSMHKVRYYIVTDGEEFWVIGHGDKEFILTSFESIVQTVRKGYRFLEKHLQVKSYLMQSLRWPRE